MNKHIILLYTTAFLLFSSVWNTLAADKTSPREGWITGEVFVRNGVLFFRTDQPVQGNTKGNVVLLGATKQAAATLLPAYRRAAEKHLKLLLYGSLLPFSGSMPGYSEPLPSIQFITWTVHLPSDPDELSPDQKIIIR